MENLKDKKTDDILEKLVHINRITKVVKGGRRFGFSALVVVGNQAGKIGIAHAKAKQVPDAIKKANELAMHENDTGSSEIQIALLTEKIETLSKHIKQFKKDKHSSVGLLRAVNRRKKLLDYLKRNKINSYKNVLSKLNLRK